MQLELSDEQARDLRELLEVGVSDLSHEIAATDNASYRSELTARRDRLASVAAILAERGT